MKESHFEKVLNDATNAYVQEDRDYAKYIWNAAIQLAVLQLKQNHRFNAAAQVELLLEKEKEDAKDSPVIAEFKRERREALMSLDEKTIRDYMEKWDGNRGHPDPETFMIGVHKAITGCNDLPIEFRRKSRAYLIGKGFHPLDDGEL